MELKADPSLPVFSLFMLKVSQYTHPHMVWGYVSLGILC